MEALLAISQINGFLITPDQPMEIILENDFQIVLINHFNSFEKAKWITYVLSKGLNLETSLKKTNRECFVLNKLIKINYPIEAIYMEKLSELQLEEIRKAYIDGIDLTTVAISVASPMRLKMIAYCFKYNIDIFKFLDKETSKREITALITLFEFYRLNKYPIPENLEILKYYYKESLPFLKKGIEPELIIRPLEELIQIPDTFNKKQFEVINAEMTEKMNNIDSYQYEYLKAVVEILEQNIDLESLKKEFTKSQIVSMRLLKRFKVKNIENFIPHIKSKPLNEDIWISYVEICKENPLLTFETFIELVEEDSYVAFKLAGSLFKNKNGEYLNPAVLLINDCWSARRGLISLASHVEDINPYLLKSRDEVLYLNRIFKKDNKAIDCFKNELSTMKVYQLEMVSAALSHDQTDLLDFVLNIQESKKDIFIEACLRPTIDPSAVKFLTSDKMPKQIANIIFENYISPTKKDISWIPLNLPDFIVNELISKRNGHV